MIYDPDFTVQSRLIFLAERRRARRLRILGYASIFILTVGLASAPLIAGWL
jgi:hypothetical protein